MGDDTPLPEPADDARDVDLRQARVDVAPIDADRLRNAVSARLFGSAAEPVKIGRFTVLRRLGAGGMGVVYSAYDDQLDRKVAIKLLHAGEHDEARRTRLLREAQALARLSHPNVVHVYEVGTFREQIFVAMEFVQGQTLGRYLADNKRTPDDILTRFVAAGHGLAAAHAAGLVHRDFKPDNVLVADDGRTLVVDFGLARAASTRTDDPTPPSDEATPHAPANTDEPTTTDSLDAELTRTGAVLGTPAYMAPEQHRGATTDARSDQFSFCVALWEALAGERPFAGASVVELALAVNRGDIQSSATAKPIAGRLRRALQRGLAVDPAQRFPDMPTLLLALSPPRSDRRRVAWVSAATASCVALGVVAWASTRPTIDPCDGGANELVGVWDDSVRSEMQAAFLGTHESFAPDAWQRTSAQLESYADAWQAMHRDACERSIVKGDQSPELFGRRMVCLGQNLTAMAQLTSLLRDAGKDEVFRAVQAVGELPEIAVCANEAKLMAFDAPVDDETRTRLAEVDALIARSDSALTLGSYDRANELSEQAVALASRLGHNGRLARARLIRGFTLIRREEFEQAIIELRDSARLADMAGDDATRVRALARLTSVLGSKLRKFDEADTVADDTLAAVTRLGDAPRLVGEVYGQLAGVARQRGNFEQALAYQERALALLREELGDDHMRVAISLHDLGNVFSDLGRKGDAEAMQRRALEAFEHSLGPRHPHVAVALLNLGKQISESAPQRFFGRNPDEVIARCEEAEPLLRRAIAIYEDRPDAGVEKIGSARQNLGEAMRCAGRYREALDQFKLALEIKKQDKAKDKQVSTLNGIARCHLELGDLDTAAKWIDQAQAIAATPKVNVKPVLVAETTFIAAELARRNHKPDDSPPSEAIAMAHRARALYDETGDGAAKYIAAVDSWLAKHDPAALPAAPHTAQQRD